MYKKILIATDGSSTAAHAVEVGVDVARTLGADTILLHVGDQSRGEKVLAEAAKAVGGKAQMITVEGDPADKILEAAENHGVDLIVVGNKGMTGAKRFLLGSVPNQVSHHAPCNVLIVKTT
ncbi:MAG: universal stress protein [Actinomycetota bacterium]